MNRLLRVVLIWVMVFAMPAQGMAAAIMAACGPSDARLQRAGTQCTAHSACDANHRASAQIGAADAFQAVAAEPSNDAEVGACAACAACCSAVPIMNSASLPPAGETSSAAAPWTVAGFRSLVTTVPEHPPRPLLV